MQDSTEFSYYVTRNGLRYENPRRMPKKWLENYLYGRSPEMLALDAMRAFDEIWQVKRQLKRAQGLNIALTGIVTTLAVKGLEIVIQHWFR